MFRHMRKMHEKDVRAIVMMFVFEYNNIVCIIYFSRSHLHFFFRKSPARTNNGYYFPFRYNHQYQRLVSSSHALLLSLVLSLFGRCIL